MPTHRSLVGHGDRSDAAAMSEAAVISGQLIGLALRGDLAPAWGGSVTATSTTPGRDRPGPTRKPAHPGPGGTDGQPVSGRGDFGCVLVRRIPASSCPKRAQRRQRQDVGNKLETYLYMLSGAWV